MTNKTDKTDKRCSNCETTKPHSEYYKSASQPDGHDAYCKVCRRAKTAEYTAANPNYSKDYYRNVEKPRRAAQKEALRRLRELDPTWEPSA